MWVNALLICIKDQQAARVEINVCSSIVFAEPTMHTHVHTRYSSVSIALHWFMLLLIAGAYASIELRELFPKGSDPRNALKTIHFMLGLSVFFIVWWRIAARVFSPTPAITPPIPHMQHQIAKAMHITLYVFMIAMPFLGWLLLSAEGKSIPFWGFELPALANENHDVAEQVEEIHETLGKLGYFLIAAHAAAALAHHYLKKNDSLRRMWFTH